MHKIKKLLMDKLKNMENLNEISAGALDQIHKITDTIKNIDKIEKLEGGGDYSNARGNYGGSYGREYSEAYDSGESYDSENSGRGRGMHYVRGHYSRDGGGYSGDNGTREMMRLLDGMLDGVQEPRQREAIMRFKREFERM